MKTKLVAHLRVGFLTTSLVIPTVSAQNVGIGTSSPQSKLSVNGSTVSGGMAIGDLSFTSTLGTVAPLNGAMIQGTVGIGTTAPTAKLDVESGNIELSLGNALRWGADDTGERVYTQPGLGFPGNNLYLESRENMIFISDRNNTAPANTAGFIWASNISWQEGTPTEHMRLTDAGNLGIGVAAPTERLHVNTSVVNEGIALSQISATNTIMLNSNTGGAYLGFINNSTSTDAALTGFIQNREPTATGGSANDLFYSASLGSHHFNDPVGINTGAPAAGFWLDVAGNMQCNNLQLALYAGTTNREIGVNAAGSVIIFASDSRLKKDVAELTGGLDKLMKLRPVSYNWKDTVEYGEQREIGFIAQEVKCLIPEVIGTFKKDEEEYNTLSYARMVPVVVDAIQQFKQGEDERFARQQEEIDQLKAENVKLKAQAGQFAAIAARLESIEKLVAATSVETSRQGAVATK